MQVISISIMNLSDSFNFTNIADSHNHLHFPKFDNDREAVIRRAADCGIKTMLCVGIDPEDSKRALRFTRLACGIYAAIGIHPNKAAEYISNDVYDLESLVLQERVVAIGETGFDMFHQPDTFQQQKKIFCAHVELAKKCQLPIVIHDREAHEQTLRVMDDTNGWELGGVWHCFSGDTKLAEMIVRKGFYISVPGVITFNNAKLLRSVIARIPQERLLVETDAPYLSPVPYRGRRNEPSFLWHTIKKVAELQMITPEHCAQIATRNFHSVFGMKSLF